MDGQRTRSESWAVTLDGRTHSLALEANGLSLSDTESGQGSLYLWDDIDAITFPTTFSVQLASAGQTVTLGFRSGALQREFRSALQEVTDVAAGIPVERQPQHQELGREWITTLQEFPGHVITHVHGLVTEVSANSGWTATSKGTRALDLAIYSLGRSARQMGANAIVGLSATTFGAHGGITSALGGDAVGVLMLGTAVTIEPMSRMSAT